MKIVRPIAELREARRSAAGSVGFVPTMGALHAGHASLFAAARAECDTAVASIFVNEAQFGSAADFASYPRDEERDLRVAEDAGIDLVFAPTAEELYPPGFRTWVEPNE